MYNLYIIDNIPQHEDCERPGSTESSNGVKNLKEQREELIIKVANTTPELCTFMFENGNKCKALKWDVFYKMFVSCHDL